MAENMNDILNPPEPEELLEPQEPAEPQEPEPGDIDTPSPGEPPKAEDADALKAQIRAEIEAEMTAEREKVKAQQLALTKERERVREKETALEVKPEKPEHQAEFIPPGFPAAPSVEQFETYEEYVRAEARWAARLELAQEKYFTQQNAMADSHAKRINLARQAHADFDQVMESAKYVPIDNRLAPVLQDSDNSAELIYFLVKNPAEMQRINALPLHRQVMEIGKIESRLGQAEPQGNETDLRAKIEAEVRAQIEEEAKKAEAEQLVSEKLKRSGFSEVRSAPPSQAKKFSGPTPMKNILGA